jgi:pyruvate formate lyase activating enzyme
VFFKGCPLSCLWCANPEGRSFQPSLTYTPVLCIRCGACVQTCPTRALSMTEQGLDIDRDRCTLCGDCVEGCYAEALAINSARMTADEIVGQVERDRVFYDISGHGGITLTGGEPLAQPEFALELLKLCKARGMHTAIETCGQVPFEALERVLPYLDLIFFDIKHMDEEAHRECTGAGNERILANLKRLQAYDVEICVRVPVVSTLNDSLENMEATAAFVWDLPRVRSVELLPYHRLGVNKYQKLGLDYPIAEIPVPEKEEMERLKALFEAHGIECVLEA